MMSVSDLYVSEAKIPVFKGIESYLGLWVGATVDTPGNPGGMFAYGWDS